MFYMCRCSHDFSQFLTWLLWPFVFRRFPVAVTLEYIFSQFLWDNNNNYNFCLGSIPNDVSSPPAVSTDVTRTYDEEQLSSQHPTQQPEQCEGGSSCTWDKNSDKVWTTREEQWLDHKKCTHCNRNSVHRSKSADSSHFHRLTALFICFIASDWALLWRFSFLRNPLAFILGIQRSRSLPEVTIGGITWNQGRLKRRIHMPAGFAHFL